MASEPLLAHFGMSPLAMETRRFCRMSVWRSVRARPCVSIGPNGAGKSTVLLTILGYLKPSMGTVSFANEEITAHDPHRVVRKGICVLSAAAKHLSRNDGDGASRSCRLDDRGRRAHPHAPRKGRRRCFRF